MIIPPFGREYVNGANIEGASGNDSNNCLDNCLDNCPNGDCNCDLKCVDN
jgi:hypothetical protein